MSEHAPPRPFYLSSDGTEDVFAMFHAPVADAPARSAVLLCPPFGWDEACSYRCRREWAEDLAAAGHPCLRIDLPGCGDSAASPADPGRLDAWTRAIAGAAAWLAANTTAPSIAAIGVSSGGLLACRALSEGAAIDELVLWATPSRGRAFVRELRVFAELDASKPEDGSEELLAPRTDDEIRAGGFLLSAETTRALKALDVAELSFPAGRPTRVLLLDRDGIPVDERLRTALEGAGARVSVSSGKGYGGMIIPPHQAQPPVDVFVRTREWLGERPRGEPNAAPARRPPDQLARGRDLLELSVGDQLVRETPLELAQPFGSLFAVLVEPVGIPNSGLTVALLNAGGHRRIGQGRMWVEAGRRWAALGVPTLRLDVEGIGDAGGAAARFSNLGELYNERLVDQVLAALDALDERGLGPRYVLSGLCSGAFWSFHSALRDTRVSAALMLNPQTLFWDATQPTARVLRAGVRGVRRASSWRKLLRGEIPLELVLGAVRRAPTTVVRRALARRRSRRAGGDAFDRALERLHENGKRAHFIFSGGEPLHEEFELEGRLERIVRWPNVTIEYIPGDDHILRPIESQRAAHQALDQQLELELARVAANSASIPSDAAAARADGARSAARA